MENGSREREIPARTDKKQPVCAYAKVYLYMRTKTIAMFIWLRGMFTIYHFKAYIRLLMVVFRHDKMNFSALIDRNCYFIWQDCLWNHLPYVGINRIIITAASQLKSNYLYWSIHSLKTFTILIYLFNYHGMKELKHLCTTVIDIPIYLEKY